MAAASLINPPALLRFRPSPPPLHLSNSSLKNSRSNASPIICGPRDNRGPLVRGRTLSTEAILAVQALKRAKGDDSKIDQIVSNTLVRLIKADLLAALAELQRQDQTRLALKVFVAVRKEFWYKTDFALYGQMVSALARNGMVGEIDVLVSDLMKDSGGGGGISSDDIRGLARLVKALVAAGRGKDVRDIYREMKRGGCVPDEFLFKVLSRGLRRLAEPEAADEVEKDLEVWLDGGVRREPLRVW